MEFYPLAEYCNGLIAAFNELRLCAPVAIAQSCIQIIQESLQSVAKTMLLFYKQEQQVHLYFRYTFDVKLYFRYTFILLLSNFLQAFTKGERENMVNFAECLSDQLIPYVQYCIQAIFPPNQVAQHVGVSVGQLQKEVYHIFLHKYINKIKFYFNQNIISFAEHHQFESKVHNRVFIYVTACKNNCERILFTGSSEKYKCRAE